MQNVDRGITGSSLAGSAIILEIGSEYGVIELRAKTNGPRSCTVQDLRTCGSKALITLECAPDDWRTVLVGFKTAEAAKKFHESPEYTPAQGLREDAAVDMQRR